MKAIIRLPKIYFANGRWRIVPSAGVPRALDRNVAALQFISRLNRRASGDAP